MEAYWNGAIDGVVEWMNGGEIHCGTGDGSDGGMVGEREG